MTCPGCPSQWNAWNTDGDYLYLRYRHGRGTVEQQPSPDVDTWTGRGRTFEEDTCYLHTWDDGTGGGFLTLDEFMANVPGMALAEGADYDPEGYYNDDGEPVTTAPEQTTQEPTALQPAEPMLEGTFAIFEPGDGSLMLVWRKAQHPTAREQIRALALDLVGEAKEIGGDTSDAFMDVAGRMAKIANQEPGEPSQYMPIPAMVINLASQMSGGSLDPLQMMSMLKGAAG
jgi:hypothetical protein